MTEAPNVPTLDTNMHREIPDRTARTPHRNVFLILAFVIYSATFAYAVWQGVTDPVRNWDMLAYVGSVISLDTSDPQAIHDRMLIDVKPVVPPELYREFSEKNPLSADPVSFYRILPLYRLKPLYIGAIWLAHRLGAGIAQATWLVSACSFAVLGIALAWWRPRGASRGVWLLAVVALCLLGQWPMAMLAAWSTPDALSLALFMLAFVAWNRHRSAGGFAVCALLSILARPDALLLVLALTGWFAFAVSAERRLRPCAAIFIAAAVSAAYLSIGIVGWNVLFYHTFVDIYFDFTKSVVKVTGTQYRRALVWGLLHEMQNARMKVFIALSMIALWCHRQCPSNQREWLWLLLMTWAVFVIRFLIFPAWGDERYYYPVYLLLLMSCLELIAPWIKASQEERDKPRPL